MKTILIGLIRAYRLLISPLLGPSCRFQPTCSQYAIEAIERFGIWRGSGLAVGRILRCHPFNPGGYDPVPQLSHWGDRMCCCNPDIQDQDTQNQDSGLADPVGHSQAVSPETGNSETGNPA